MDRRTLAVVILFLVSLFFFIYYLNNSKHTPIPSSKFFEELRNAKNIYIIMDLRNASSDAVRTNIMQCGVDFAGSVVLVGKNITIFAFENNECTSLEGIKSINYCLGQSENGITIHIREGSGVGFYEKLMVVGIGEKYDIPCSLKYVE